MFTAFIQVLFVASVLARPLSERATGPSVTIQNGTVIGSTSNSVDSFIGIPFAQPPVGNLRLKPPQTISAPFGTITATGTPTACPQFYLDTSSFPTDVLGTLLNVPFLQQVQTEGEDCLNLNVQRPSTATAASKLPVLFWIYGGGFEFGSTQLYDGSNIIKKSVELGKPIIFVAVNYRVGGFGFLAGKELQGDGSTNLGLRDQRLALKWVQDNIAAFGGDPSKVTIWGESAGAISVFDHMIIEGGNNLYNGNPMFRAGIMDSGSVVPTNPVDSPKAQAIYDAVVAKAGCSDSSDTLACLREADYEKFLNAVNSVPGFLSFRSIDLSYLPRPDPTDNFFPVSPELGAGSFAKVPVIIGDQEDEGTLFSLFQSNLTTTDDIVTYLESFFPNASKDVVQGLVDLYPEDPSTGSPFRTGTSNQLYPQFKRLAAILGDATFTLARRGVLSIVASEIPAWSYLGSYFYDTPILGTFHASDVVSLFILNLPPSAVQSISTFYISFVNDLDPNTSQPPLLWPKWNSANPQLMNFELLDNQLITDDFRSEAGNYLLTHVTDFRV